MAEQIRLGTLAELAEKLGGEVVGDASVALSRPIPAGTDDPTGITFAESTAYLEKAMASRIGAIIVPQETPDLGVPMLRHPRPREAFAQILAMSSRPLPLSSGVHALAVIHPEAKVDPSASVGPFVTIAQGAVIGAEVKLHPGCYIGENCRVGAGCRLHPNVVLVQDVVLGERCLLHSGVVLGADGFGFQWTGERQYKIPQVGRVVLGDDVEIGANSCIDRATCGDTIIGHGVKIDNLVQIGHNVTVGDHTVVASLVGVSGSSRIGRRVTVAGQVGISDHISVGDNVVLGGMSGVISDISEPGAYQGFPAMPIGQAMRVLASQPKLPDILSRLRALEREIEQLKRGQSDD